MLRMSEGMLMQIRCICYSCFRPFLRGMGLLYVAMVIRIAGSIRGVLREHEMLPLGLTLCLHRARSGTLEAETPDREGFRVARPFRSASFPYEARRASGPHPGVDYWNCQVEPEEESVTGPLVQTLERDLGTQDTDGAPIRGASRSTVDGEWRSWRRRMSRRSIP